MKKSFDYEVYPDDTAPKGYAEVPMLWVRLFYQGDYDDISCLVDSGADECIFHSSVAENLGIDWKSGIPKKYYPVGQHAITGYVHTIELQIHDFDERIKIQAGFTQESEFCLLGQYGFFDNYEITFRGFEKRFEIASRPQAGNVFPIKWPHPK